jgi:hypothetical protein
VCGSTKAEDYADSGAYQPIPVQDVFRRAEEYVCASDNGSDEESDSDFDAHPFDSDLDATTVVLSGGAEEHSDSVDYSPCPTVRTVSLPTSINPCPSVPDLQALVDYESGSEAEDHGEEEVDSTVDVDGDWMVEVPHGRAIDESIPINQQIVDNQVTILYCT